MKQKLQHGYHHHHSPIPHLEDLHHHSPKYHHDKLHHHHKPHLPHSPHHDSHNLPHPHLAQPVSHSLPVPQPPIILPAKLYETPPKPTFDNHHQHTHPDHSIIPNHSPLTPKLLHHPTNFDLHETDHGPLSGPQQLYQLPSPLLHQELPLQNLHQTATAVKGVHHHHSSPLQLYETPVHPKDHQVPLQSSLSSLYQTPFQHVLDHHQSPLSKTKAVPKEYLPPLAAPINHVTPMPHLPSYIPPDTSPTTLIPMLTPTFPPAFTPALVHQDPILFPGLSVSGANIPNKKAASIHHQFPHAIGPFPKFVPQNLTPLTFPQSTGTSNQLLTGSVNPQQLPPQQLFKNENDVPNPHHTSTFFQSGSLQKGPTTLFQQGVVPHHPPLLHTGALISHHPPQTANLLQPSTLLPSHSLGTGTFTNLQSQSL